MRLSGMPCRSGVQQILLHGKSKYEWKWLQDNLGDWWGAKYQEDHIYQLRGEAPDFQVRTWSNTISGGYCPRPQWEFFDPEKL